MTPPPTYVGCCFVTLYSALLYCIQRRSTTNIPELWLRTQLYRSSPILWSRRKFSLPCALRSKGSLWIKTASFWRSLFLDEIRVSMSLGKADCLPEGRENGDISVDGINIWNRFKNKMVLFIPPSASDSCAEVTSWSGLTWGSERLVHRDENCQKRAVERAQTLSPPLPLSSTLLGLQMRASEGPCTHKWSSFSTRPSCCHLRTVYLLTRQSSFPSHRRKASLFKSSGTVSLCLQYFNYYRPICSIEEAVASA